MNHFTFCEQFTIRNGRGRYGGPVNDRKPLVLSTYLDAQEHLPYADDSNAVTPMSEENGTILVPMYYGNLGSSTQDINTAYLILFPFLFILKTGSRHSSYTSHQSRISYTSHGDLLGGLAGIGGNVITKESKLRNRSSRHQSMTASNGNSYIETNHKEYVGYKLSFM